MADDKAEGSSNQNTSGSTTDEGADDGTVDSAPSLADGPGKTRNLKFRRELLTRLPKLHYASWKVGDQFSVDDDLDDVVDLGADAVLKPLEKLVDRMDRT